MKVMVTGATGFIGRHLVSELLKKKYNIIAVSRGNKPLQEMPWAKDVSFACVDLYQDPDFVFKNFGIPDVLIHLSWPGLPNFTDLFHLTENLPNDLIFLNKAVNLGVKHIIVTGSCLEYGIYNGELDESLPTKPTTSYGLAKDTIRKSLQIMQQKKTFTFQWLRLFYMFGDGQNEKSLFSQINKAIDNRDEVFKMSPGDQVRDYMPIEEVATIFCKILKNKKDSGVFNLCSGNPIQVFELVNRWVKKRNSDIMIERGVLNYPEYEPFAFWGSTKKINSLILQDQGKN
jgi:dTDP-6-deoxy-L-talose 4-dehydrogenase (NAD+)